MDEVKLEVYLFFKGDCKAAMEFYKSVFGGELTLQTYGEIPGSDAKMKDMVMHAKLEGGGLTLMASDTEGASAQSKKISLSLGGTNETKLREMFDKLSAGGKVTTPLKKEFWGDIFGQFTDKFGIDWMVNIATPKQ